MDTPLSNKQLKEQFVSNLTGSSLLEIAALTVTLPILVLIRHSFNSIPITGNSLKKKKDDAPSEHRSFKAYLSTLTLDFLVIVVPMLLLFTVLADWSYIIASLFTILTLLYIAVKRPGGSSPVLEEPNSVRAYITSYRVIVMIITILCILAVDFRIFPRRYAKTETYGASLGFFIRFSQFRSISFKMTQDLEMKDRSTPSNSVSPPIPSTLQHLKEIATLIETGSYSKEVRRIARAVRLTIALRRKLTASVITSFLDHVLTPGSESHAKLSAYLPKEDDHEMEVDAATSAIQTPTTKHLLPELEIYCYLLVLLFLIDQKKYNEAKACSSASVAWLKNVNRRTVDVIASRLFFYYSYSHELTGDLAEIRGNLLALHRIATLRHDELGQETLLNLLLRNYLHYNLFDQAEKLRSKAPRFEAHSNQQFCRYLFYLGKIRTIQLEYTDAKESLLQAARKAPVAARGFRIQCNKWAIIVRLLLGEIPERTVFMQKGMEKALRPYFELTNAVRIGDLELFKNIADKFATTFSADGTHNLIVRLRHNVIRTGLRNISISYSRISLADVAKKLRLDSPNPVADAESIVSKAIRDGAIDATLDHSSGWMVSKETGDIYSTNEPQQAFNSRIAFCLNMHNEAVRALRFPPNTHKEKESAEKRRERQQQEQELAKHIAEEDDDDF